MPDVIRVPGRRFINILYLPCNYENFPKIRLLLLAQKEDYLSLIRSLSIKEALTFLLLVDRIEKFIKIMQIIAFNSFSN